MWNEKQIPIKEIKDLLEQGYEVEVDSPDGFVPVSLFVDKGEWDEYRLDLCDGRSVLVNENHLFETPDGWTYAKDMHRGKFPSYLVLTDTGWVEGKVTKTDNKIPIVDIQVEHENHRYYTNGVSSHNTNVGKSLAMCHMAAYNLMKGCNVLYITCEMAEERIAERIDANLTNTTMDELAALSREDYLKKVNRVQQKAKGKLIIKEYPTASAHTGHFRHLIHELKLKRNFKPDIIYVDYINICASARLKMGGSVNSYGYIKAIAEELRGLAQELDLPIVTATQTTRSGFSNSDLSLEDTSECIAVDQHITLVGGETKEIGNVKLGDQITSASADFNTTMVVHHKKIKPCVKITTASGKTIIVSRDHVFPMKNEDGTTARLSVNTGLKVGDVLKSVN